MRASAAHDRTYTAHKDKPNLSIQSHSIWPNNCDLNTDQPHCDNHFAHNRAALTAALEIKWFN